MLTEEQKTLRQRYIGSSDAPAICGVDPFRSAADVYLEKTGLADGFGGNDNTDRGTLLEPVIINWFEQQVGVPLRRNMFITRTDCDDLCANLDAFMPACDLAPNGGVVEGKSSVNADEWGDENTDQVPERVIVQTHHAMWMVGASCRVAFVPVLLPGYRSFDFRRYRVDRNDELAEAIAARCVAFKREHIDVMRPPDDFKPSLEVLKRIRREPNKVVPIPADVVDTFVMARARRIEATELEDVAKAGVLAAMGDAECGDCGNGKVVMYMESKRRGYVVEDTTYRTLRVKTQKDRQ